MELVADCVREALLLCVRVAVDDELEVDVSEGLIVADKDCVCVRVPVIVGVPVALALLEALRVCV